MKLYIYDHCPFCVKARMIFGLKNIPVELNVLQNDDEATPTRMIGQKMVPILQKMIAAIFLKVWILYIMSTTPTANLC